jgi:hypothetical protein
VAAADLLAQKVDKLEGRLQQQGLEGMQDLHSKSEFAVGAGVGWRAPNMHTGAWRPCTPHLPLTPPSHPSPTRARCTRRACRPFATF